MANINFYLKNVAPNKDGEKPIILQITWNYKKFRKQIERINPRYWNQRKQEVRPPGTNEKDNRYVEINTLIDKFNVKAKDFFNECLKENIELDEDLIKNFLDGKEVIKKKAPKFFEAFEEFIEMKKIDHAERTYMGYQTVLNFLKNFQNEMGYQIKWNAIDISFFDKLKYYSFNIKEISDNYFAKIISTIKNFLNWSTERGYNTSQAYQKFTYSEKEKEVVFLTVKELMHLLQYKFKNERLTKARDIYCFGCFTGLRISDINQLRHEHIKDGYLSKKIQKTKKFEQIPLNKFALEILAKYKDMPVKALPKLSAQKLNDYIKECCQEAKINSPLTTINYRGGKAIESTKPKYELITSHTARKTFVTNSLVLGMNIKAIKEITGHKKDSTFNKYLKIAEDFKKSEMDKTWNNLN
ncbi:MAG TPA: site-specific integrase [Bacteroidales bacterium]